MIPHKTRLILALDVTEREKAIEIARAVSGCVDAIKVNYPLVLGAGLPIVNDMAKYSPVICDFKIADIPNTNTLIVKNVLKYSASGIIAHGFTGRDSLRACIEAGEGKLDTFVVTEMSHPGALDFLAAFAEPLARLAVEAGATGVVAPATRPDRVAKIRKIVGSLKIISPGVGAQGGSAADTIRAGADYIIVGRQIYNDKDPAAAAMALEKEIKGVA